MKKAQTAALWLVIAVVLVGGIYWLTAVPSEPGELDGFAQCLKDKGVVFYGAFWCPHCQNQKRLFGNSERLLPYVECSTVDGNGQVPYCQERGIKSYPTWEFSDGSRESGELSLGRLAEKSECELPTNA